jgi:uncharacterized OB-fold protein
MEDETLLSDVPPDELFSLKVDIWTAPFWEAAQQRRLTIPRCPSCKMWRMPPTPFCPNCQTKGMNWTEVAPEGRLYSWTVVVRAPGLTLSAPYIPAVVNLPHAGNVRLVTVIVGATPEELMVDIPLDLHWQVRTDGVVIPRFTPSSARGPAQ